MADGTPSLIALRDGRKLAYTYWGVQPKAENAVTSASRQAGAKPAGPAAGAGAGALVTLLALHGFCDCRLESRGLHEDALANGMTILSIDRPGHGASTHNPNQTMESFAEDVRELLDALGLRKVAVMGASGGAPFGCAVATLLPERVSALLLLTALYPVKGVEEELLGDACASVKRMFDGVRNHPWRAWAELHFARLMGKLRPSVGLKGAFPEIENKPLDDFPEKGLMLAQASREGLSRGIGGALHDLNVYFMEPMNEKHLSGIRCKTIVWHGDSDAIAPPNMARRYAAAIPGAQLRLVKGGGHFAVSFYHGKEVMRSIKEAALQR